MQQQKSSFLSAFVKLFSIFFAFHFVRSLQAMTKMGFVSNKEEEASKCLKEMDLDGDGRVSYAEFMVKWRIT